MELKWANLFWRAQLFDTSAAFQTTAFPTWVRLIDFSCFSEPRFKGICSASGQGGMQSLLLRLSSCHYFPHSHL